MAIALNNICGILKEIHSHNGISRLVLQSGEQIFYLLLLEELAQDSLEKSLEIAFKETNIILALELKGANNTFQSKILKIQSDLLFARLFLEFLPSKNGVIEALVDLDFLSKNRLEVGNFVFWHIPESEIMLLGVT